MKMWSMHRHRPSIEIWTPGRPQALGEGEAGDLAALIGIEDLRLAVASQRLLELLDAKAGEVEREIRRPAGFCQEQTHVLTEQFSSMEHDRFHVSVSVR